MSEAKRFALNPNTEFRRKGYEHRDRNYVADLAACNNGKLHGAWMNATDVWIIKPGEMFH